MSLQTSISIIIPFYNEEGCVDAVINEIREKIPKAEIVAINDGSTDRTLEILEKHSGIHTISSNKNRGQGFAVYEGLKHASHEKCILMDGDGQYDPADIPLFIKHLENVDLVYGVRKSRQDKQSVVLISKIANFLRRIVLRDGVTDTGCGLKAIRKSKSYILPAFEGTHRYIPAFFLHAGFKIKEIEVNHRPRLHGKTKYTHTSRALRGIIDLARVMMIIKRWKMTQLEKNYV